MITYLLFENRIFLNVVPNDLHISVINNLTIKGVHRRAYTGKRGAAPVVFGKSRKTNIFTDPQEGAEPPYPPHLCTPLHAMDDFVRI